jgi:hypothetical protein
VQPGQQIACMEGEPDHEVAAHDTRSVAQRQHDALECVGALPVGQSGVGLNGLPVVVVSSATLQVLCSAAGVGVTATGTLLPMREVIHRA